MKSSINCYWPLISVSGARDEREEGTFLVHGDHEGKVTAKDMGDYWYIREWEPYSKDGVMYWFDSYGYSLCKDMIKALSALQD